MSELLLGVDIGTMSSKAVLARADGTLVASATRQHAAIEEEREAMAEFTARPRGWHPGRSR